MSLWKSKPSRRRGWDSSRSGVVEGLESRVVMSAVATVPVATESVAAVTAGGERPSVSAGDLVGPAAGTSWDFDTDFLDGKVTINQSGVKVTASIESDILDLDGKGVFRNGKLVLRFKAELGPLSAKLKLTGNVSGGGGFSGVLKGKLPIVGKFSTPINGFPV